jgi:hypothetical protein
MTDILCGFFDMIGNFISSVLPDLSNSGISQISDSVKFFANLIGAANYLFPVSTLFEIMGIFIAFKIYTMGLWFFGWLIRTIRG